MNLRKIFLGIFLLTLLVLMLELALTRLFSATLYYHLAFFAISLALLGAGSSGVFIYLIQERLAKHGTGKLLGLFSILYALAVILALYTILENPILKSDLADYFRLSLRLATIYGATFLPFFFAGCAVTLAISRFAKDISRVYLYDLAGAALGCLLLIPVLNSLGAITTVILIGAVGALAGVFFSLFDTENRTTTIAASAVLVLITAFGIVNSKTQTFDIQGSKWNQEENILFAKWNSFSRITVGGDLEKKEVLIMIDADAATKMVPDAGNRALHQDRKKDVSSLAYHIKPNANALIVGPGGALDVSTALVLDAKKITAVEINPIIAEDVMLTEPFKSFTGNIYEHPQVDLVVDEGRSFIRRSPDKFDILQATMVDTWAATSAGAFALTENNLYTVEAFKDYVGHLSDDGLLTMTRWYFEPPDQMLRMVTITRAMMSEMQIGNPARHFILVQSINDTGDPTPATYIFKKSEFTDDEVRKIEAIAAENNFVLLYTPLTQPDNLFTKMITAEDPASIWNALETDVSPTYDNNPFFFNSLRPSQLQYLAGKPLEWLKTNVGTFVLIVLLLITFVLVILFIALPLVFARKRTKADNTPRRMRYLIYFGCLGAGFIVVEVAMIQKFILFLGHPVYALAVILFSILIFCAFGSRLSGWIDETKLRPTLLKIIIAIVGLTFLYILFLPPIFYGFVWLPLAVRIVISVLLLAPIALLMGMPMPIGIKLLSEHSPQIIPWAWGINGATSVMGSVATLIIAILTGFNQALVVGAAIYLIAGLLIYTSKAAPPQEVM
ncbi:MAG: hypothetical protein H7070_04750 [Saprospiraceae bacterium]|nr:hypothetical protein [Pyrinomonadaceae bacterium]